MCTYLCKVRCQLCQLRKILHLQGGESGNIFLLLRTLILLCKFVCCVVSFLTSIFHLTFPRETLRIPCTAIQLLQDKTATPKSQGSSSGRYNEKYRGGPGEKGGNSNSWESPGYKHSPAGAKPSPMYQNRSSVATERAKDKTKGGC